MLEKKNNITTQTKHLSASDKKNTQYKKIAFIFTICGVFTIICVVAFAMQNNNYSKNTLTGTEQNSTIHSENDKKEISFSSVNSLRRLPEDYTSADAERDGCIIAEQSFIDSTKIIKNANLLCEFIEKVQKGENATLRFFYQYDDPELNFLHVADISYEYNTFLVSYRCDSDITYKQFSFIKSFEYDETNKTIYLLNDDEATFDEIKRNPIQSDTNRWIENWSLGILPK